MEEFEYSGVLAVAAPLDLFCAWSQLRLLVVHLAEPLKLGDLDKLLSSAPLLRWLHIVCPQPPPPLQPQATRAVPCAPLHTMKHLESFQTRGCAFDEAFFATFSFPRLERLALGSGAVRVSHFEQALERMSACTYLRISDDALVTLARPTTKPLALQQLFVSSKDCRGRDLRCLLRSSPHLVELDVDEPTSVTDSDLSMMPAQQLRNLRFATLAVHPEAAVSARTIAPFIELCPELRELRFPAASVGEETIDELSRLYRGRTRKTGFTLRDAPDAADNLLWRFDRSGPRKPEKPAAESSDAGDEEGDDEA